VGIKKLEMTKVVCRDCNYEIIESIGSYFCWTCPKCKTFNTLHVRGKKVSYTQPRRRRKAEEGKPQKRRKDKK